MYSGCWQAGVLLTQAAAVVLAREGGSYRILLDGRERSAVLRGKARRGEDRAVAGDRVEIDPATLNDEVLGIASVCPRSSLLERRVPDGRGTRPVAANVDQVVVVMAAARPEPVLQLLDRFLLAAESDDIPVQVVINKIDLALPDSIEHHLRGTGYPVLTTSARLGTGLEELRRIVIGRENVFAGPSGVGKSSLLNALEPDLGLRVGAISERIGRGRNTTVTARMVPLAAGGFVVDTPGFSDVGLWEVVPSGLSLCFPEFRRCSGECRFSDCLHQAERGCAVKQAVDLGEIPLSRYASYLAILAEILALPPSWS